MTPWDWFVTIALPYFGIGALCLLGCIVLAFLALVLKWFLGGFFHGLKSERAAMTRISAGVSSVNEERAAMGLGPVPKESARDH